MLRKCNDDSKAIYLTEENKHFLLQASDQEQGSWERIMWDMQLEAHPHMQYNTRVQNIYATKFNVWKTWYSFVPTQRPRIAHCHISDSDEVRSYTTFDDHTFLMQLTKCAPVTASNSVCKLTIIGGLSSKPKCNKSGSWICPVP